MSDETQTAPESQASDKSHELGRNEPCHCGSGKKYKRCHGVNAAPKLSTPKFNAPAVGAGANALTGGDAGSQGAFPGGFDPSKMDPQMMMQFTQALQRLPRGQMQRLQSIMQRAMGGKDVTREAEEFERTLPPELQQLMISFGSQMAGMGMGGMPGMGGGMPTLPAGPEAEGGMSEEEARKIVAAAAAEGKISSDEAEKLLAESVSTEEKKSGLGGKLWRGITGKNT